MNRLKNNAIIIILLLFLVVTFFFWFQLIRIKDLPAEANPARPTVNGKEAEAFIILAEELLVRYDRGPLPELYGKDPFYKEETVEQAEVVKIDPSKTLTLSSIMYSDLHPLVVVNGMILAEGDTIYDERSGFDFMIESIEVDEVAVISGDEKYTLERAYGADSGR